MQLKVSYINRPASRRLENMLNEDLEEINKLSLLGVDHAKAKVLAQSDGTNVVQLRILSPKALESMVTSSHENPYVAGASAVEKLKRRIKKCKGKIVGRRKERSEQMFFESMDDDTLDASQVIELADFDRRLKQVAETNRSRLNNNRSSQNSQPQKITDLEGIGRRRAYALRRHLDINTIEELKAALDDGQIDRAPGIGAKLKKQLQYQLAKHD